MMEQTPARNGPLGPLGPAALLRHPSAYLPLGMSLLAIAMVLGYVALFGVVRQADEGTPAHLFQLLMVAQVPIIGFFGARWLPRTPRSAALVLALQAGAWLVPVGLILILER